MYSSYIPVNFSKQTREYEGKGRKFREKRGVY